MITGNGCKGAYDHSVRCPSPRMKDKEASGHDTHIIVFWNDLYPVTVILFIQTHFERDRGVDGNGKSKVEK